MRDPYFPFRRYAEKVIAILKRVILEDGEVRVCDICRLNPIEERKVEVAFKDVVHDKKDDGWVAAEAYGLSCTKELCYDCGEKLLKLFKKGGDKG